MLGGGFANTFHQNFLLQNVEAISLYGPGHLRLLLRKAGSGQQPNRLYVQFNAVEYVPKSLRNLFGHATTLITILLPGLVERLSGQLCVCTKIRKNRYFDTQGILVLVLEYFQVMKNDVRKGKFPPKRLGLRFFEIVRVLHFAKRNLHILQAKVVFQV